MKVLGYIGVGAGSLLISAAVGPTGGFDVRSLVALVGMMALGFGWSAVTRAKTLERAEKTIEAEVERRVALMRPINIEVTPPPTIMGWL